jgi:hypothetical protein
MSQIGEWIQQRYVPAASEGDQDVLSDYTLGAYVDILVWLKRYKIYKHHNSKMLGNKHQFCL